MTCSHAHALADAAKLVDAADFAGARQICEQLLAQDPRDVFALHILGVAERKAGNLPASLAALQRAVAVNGNYAAVHFELATTLVAQQSLEAALPHFIRAVELQPDFQPAAINTCTILERLDRLEDALEWAERAVCIDPSCAIAQFNLGNLLQGVGRVTEALEKFQLAAQLDPNLDSAVWNAALAYLSLGDFAQGWPLYEIREAARKVVIDNYPQPRWRGEPLTGKTILVHAEQGIGDEILFASCLPDLVRQAGHVVCVCDPRLAALLARSFPQMTVVGHARRQDRQGINTQKLACGPIDYQIPAGSLPCYFRPSAQHFPKHWRFLQADTVQVEKWRAQFELLGSGLKIGISWRAGGQPAERRKRTTSLLDWQRLLQLPGVQWIDLQYGDTAAELGEVRNALGVTVHHFDAADPLGNLDEFAAKIAALDLVISVGNATVHLAGALGVPTWAMLPLVPAWRWMLTGEQSLWYPSVRLFRQSTRRNWQDVFGSVAATLAQRLNVALPESPTVNLAPVTASQVTSKVYSSLDELTGAFADAVSAYNANNFAEAERLCQQIIAHSPRNAAALDLAGLAARGLGKHEAAVRQLTLAVEIDSHDPLKHWHLAVALVAAGNLTGAVEAYRRAAELAPQNWAIHFELGGALRNLGQRDEALASFQSAARLEPNNPKPLNAQGVVLMEQLRLEEAEQVLRQAIALDGNYMAAHNNLGQCLQFAGQWSAAATAFRQALAIDPTCAQARQNLNAAEQQLARQAQLPADQGVTQAESLFATDLRRLLERATELYNANEVDQAAPLAQQILTLDSRNAAALRILGVQARQHREMEKSRGYLQSAVDAHPNDAGLRFELGVTLCEMHHTREALPHYLKAVELKPQFHPPHVNISAIYEQQEHYEQVVDWTRRALAIKPNCALSHYNLANALRELGQVEEAIHEYQQSITLNPDYVKANWNLGLSYLLIGDYAHGWPLFERRIELGEVGVDRYPYPQWQGESLAGKMLLIHAEQGIGDEILFASCFDEAIAQAKHCVLVCEPRLESLFKRSFPRATVYGYARRKDGEGLRLAEPIDFQIPAGSLPRFFRRSAAAFPQRKSFLTLSDKLVADWQARLAALGPGLKVGISWRAGGKPQERRKRMIPLDTWGDILTTPGVQFVNLQYSDSQDELAEAARQFGVQVFDCEEGDPLVDMDSFAAKVAALDLVIAVGNATVHVAGAVGTEAWTLLPMVPSWRWMVRGEQSPWYASVKLYRQPQRGDWQAVLDRVANDLRARVKAPPLAKGASANSTAVASLATEIPAEELAWLDAKDTNAEVMLASITDTFNRGEQAMAAGELGAAETHFREVLQIAPRHFQALHGLGLIARATGRLDLAVRSFQRSLAMFEPVPPCHLHLGEALAAMGRHEEAAQAYLRALELDPALTAARQALAHTWQQQGKHREALAEFAKLSLQAADDPRVLVCRGISLACECRLEEAIESLLAALRHEPANLLALGALADIYHEDQRWDDAAQCLRRALALKPETPTWHTQLARILKRTGHDLEALEHMQRACQLDQENRPLHGELARLHLELGEYVQAQTLLENLLTHDPHQAEWRYLLGRAQLAQGKLATALKDFDDCLALAPQHMAAIRERAKARVLQGQLSAGWSEYAKSLHPVGRTTLPQLSCPVWSGQPLRGKQLVVVADTSLPEEILFAECYRELIAAAEHVTLLCHPRLADLWARSFPQAAMVPVPRGQESQWRSRAQFDYQIYASALPQLMRCERQRFSGSPYLVADAVKRAEWHTRLGQMGEGLKVGLVWHRPDAMRATVVDASWWAGWQSLVSGLTVAGHHAIGLQTRQEMPYEFAVDGAGRLMTPFAHESASHMDQVAACIAALDVVIAVDGSLAHLAGALGAPTWVVTQQTAGWHWLADGDRTPWYQSVRLYRQNGLGEWDKVFEQLLGDLLNRLPRTSENAKGRVPSPHMPFAGRTTYSRAGISTNDESRRAGKE